MGFYVVGHTLDAPIHVSTSVKESVIVTHIYPVNLLCFGLLDLGLFGYIVYN